MLTYELLSTKRCKSKEKMALLSATQKAIMLVCHEGVSDLQGWFFSLLRAKPYHIYALHCILRVQSPIISVLHPIILCAPNPPPSASKARHHPRPRQQIGW